MAKVPRGQGAKGPRGQGAQGHRGTGEFCGVFPLPFLVVTVLCEPQ
jgi:hypothetical protein